MKKITKYGRQACKKYAHNNQEWVRISRQHSDYCTFCPPNRGENTRGSHSRWGHKRAIKRWYATGKTRNGRWAREQRIVDKDIRNRWAQRPGYHGQIKGIEEHGKVLWWLGNSDSQGRTYRD